MGVALLEVGGLVMAEALAEHGRAGEGVTAGPSSASQRAWWWSSSGCASAVAVVAEALVVLALVGLVAWACSR